MGLFDGPGEMRARCRAMDWSTTPLGPAETWPVALRVTVQTVLAAGLPHVVLWGREFAAVYNDSYAVLIGDHHPDALGQAHRLSWPDTWDTYGPVFERVLEGETVVFEDQPYQMSRGGAVESVYLTLSCSPVPGDEGVVSGILVNLVETTAAVSRRRLEDERVELIKALEEEKARLASVFKDAPTFLAVLREPAHRFELVNDAYLQLIGYRDVVGKNIADALPETVDQGFVALLDDVFVSGRPYVGREQPIMLQRSPDGPLEQRFLDFVYMPNYENGRITGIVAHGSDVTQQVNARRHVQRLLEESDRARQEAEVDRASLADVLDSMSDAHFTTDSALRFTRVNHEFEQAMGEPRDSWIGRTVWDAFPMARGTEMEVHFRRVMSGREPVHFTHHYAGADRDFVAEMDAYPAEGGGLSVFWRDVTAQVDAATALAESERRFRAVQDASPHGSTLYRPLRDDSGQIIDFEIVYINMAGAKMAGVAPEEFVGTRLLETFPHATPNGVFERYVDAVERRVTHEWEARDMREGVDLGVHFIAVPVGDLLHVRYDDITQRMREMAERERLLESVNTAYGEARLAETRLREVFEQAPVSVAVMSGPEHVYTSFSPMYSAMVGAGRPLLGRSVREAFPELVDSPFPPLMDRVFNTGEPYHAFEQLVMLDDNGDGNLVEHYFNVGYQPLYDATGEVYAIASVAYDVTEQILARKHVEEARASAERARNEAEAANRAKGEFLAVMSHELRTPLNAIGGYAELIELGVHGPVNDAQRNALARIQVSQRHLLGLINGVLNYSRVEAGAVTYDLTTVPVHEAVSEAESLIAPQLRAKGLRFEWGGCDVGLKVHADREKLQQILLNLLSNAIKFTESRGGEAGCIAVRCTVTDERVAIHVSDTGEGIEADKLRTVFDPFVQVDQRLTRRQEGVGLGLTISRDLARGMGGDLTAESSVGEGSAFTVELPRAE